ncbi:MAG: asparaginase domain-containing protein [Campylobacterota bacterium]|nr:asparaginase domain-containing protein [Campylobacterota bacterium]
MNKIEIINTGGTFNKIYNPILGKLEVSKNNNALKTIFKYFMKSSALPNIIGLIHKDSLELTQHDRKKILKKIQNSKANKIILIHGTDTMNITAEYLSKKIKNKIIIITGAMQPFSIEPIEATSNLCSAYGYLKNCSLDGIYICMNGCVNTYDKVVKNRDLGVFQCPK